MTRQIYINIYICIYKFAYEISQIGNKIYSKNSKESSFSSTKSWFFVVPKVTGKLISYMKKRLVLMLICKQIVLINPLGTGAH